MEWKNGEKGPTCFCGMPTAVVINEDSTVNLLCIFHTKLAGATFPLPKKGRPDKWPAMSDDEMSVLVDAGYQEQPDEEPGVYKEITLPDEFDLDLPKGQDSN